jgi:hypothetical protein
VQPIKAGLKKQEKNDTIYQLDRSLLNDGRDEIFTIWQHQQSRELIRSA